MTESLKEIDENVTHRYEIKRRIGKGAYGIVWKAVDKKTKDVVALKKIFDAFRNQTDAQRTYREIVFLRELRAHPNVVQLFSILRASNNKDIYLVFEFMETDLHNVIKHGDILRDIHKRYITYQLLKALKYIHSGNVIHRDLKPCNILLDSQCQCKVADFGLARSVSFLDNSNSPSSNPALTDYVATRWYRAPEILIASKKYTKGIDMWSVGCILAEMLLGKPLFPGSSTVNQVEKIMSTITPPTSTDIDSVCTGYGSNLLQRTPPGPHISLERILNNSPPDSVDLVSQLLVFSPYKRLTAAEALEHPYVSKFRNVQKELSMTSPIIPPLCDNVQLSVDDYRNKLYEAITGNERRSGAKHSCSTGELPQKKNTSHFYTWYNRLSNNSYSRSASKLNKPQTSEGLNYNDSHKRQQTNSMKRKPMTHPSRSIPQSGPTYSQGGHSQYNMTRLNSQQSNWKTVSAAVKAASSTNTSESATAARQKIHRHNCHMQDQHQQNGYRKCEGSGDHNKSNCPPHQHLLQQQHQQTKEFFKKEIKVTTSTASQPIVKIAQKINVVRHMTSSKKPSDKFSITESPQKKKVSSRQSAPTINSSAYSQKYNYTSSTELQELRPGIRW